MSRKSDEMIAERVVETAERLEDADPTHDLDPLDVRIGASLDGTVRTVTAVLTTGGPHIEVNLSDGTVTGRWGGSSHSCHVDADDLLDRHERRYIDYWNDNVTL